MDTALEIKCPKCKVMVNVPDHYVGKQIKCPECDTIFQAAGKELVKRQIPVSKNPNGLLVVMSLLLPAIGFMAGVAFVIKGTPQDQSTAKNCLIASLISTILWGLIILGAAM